MPRPRKCRRIGYVPDNLVFEPESTPSGCVELLEEEVESIRLADFDGMDQSQAAEAMGISRGTFQRILGSARAKVADALVNGRTIRILRAPQCEKGEAEGFKGCGCCCRRTVNSCDTKT